MHCGLGSKFVSALLRAYAPEIKVERVSGHVFSNYGDTATVKEFEK